MTEQNSENLVQRTQRTHQKPREHTRIDYARQWLNIIFMLGAVVGVIVFCVSDRYTGTIIVLGAIVFKFIESVLRVICR